MCTGGDRHRLWDYAAVLNRLDRPIRHEKRNTLAFNFVYYFISTLSDRLVKRILIDVKYIFEIYNIHIKKLRVNNDLTLKQKSADNLKKLIFSTKKKKDEDIHYIQFVKLNALRYDKSIIFIIVMEF